MTTLSEDLQRLKELKRNATAADAAARGLKAERDHWQRQCFERMEREECTSHRIPDVGLFSVSSKDYANVQDRDAFVQWAQEHEPDLVQVKEREGELNSLIRQRLDDGEPLPPGVSFYTKDTISVRAS